MPNSSNKYHFPLKRMVPSHIYVELLFFSIALALLFFMKLSPEPLENFSLCPFRWLGFTNCAGCGIGHALHYAMHGEWTLSYEAHIFGIPALCIIIYRIFFHLITIIQHERKLIQSNFIGRAR